MNYTMNVTREVNHWKCVNKFNKLLHGSDVHCKHPVNSVKKFSSFSLSYLNYLGEEYHSTIREINLKCSSHDMLGPRDKGYFANKNIFVHLPCRQFILSVFTLLWIRPLATIHKTNNNFTYHHKLHFHTNIQMGVEIFPTSSVKGKENHSHIYVSIQIVHNTSLLLFTSPTLVFRITFCTLLKKKMEFKNDLIPPLVMSHLQKRLSNCHCPCKKGFSDTNILFNMKHFMYLKILEVWDTNIVSGMTACMHKHKQQSLSSTLILLLPSFSTSCQSRPLSLKLVSLNSITEKIMDSNQNNNNFSSKYFMIISKCIKVYFTIELADMYIPWKSCHYLVNTNEFIKVIL